MKKWKGKNRMIRKEIIKKRLCVLLAGLFFYTLSFSQSNFEPVRIVIYKDAAEILSRGIIRFTEQTCSTPLPMDLEPISIDLSAGQEIAINWFRVRTDTVSKNVPVENWKDILLANQNKKITVVYQVAEEFDEVTGTSKWVNAEQGLLLLHGIDESDYFIPFNQIRQVILDDNGSYEISRKTPVRVLEVGVDQDLSFIPLDLTGVYKGITWEPACRIKIIGSEKAKIQLRAMVNNTLADLQNVQILLSPGNLLFDSPGKGGEVDGGKLSIRKGDKFMMNISETDFEYTRSHECYIPWNGFEGNQVSGQYTASEYMIFNEIKIPEFGCPMFTVVDEVNRPVTLAPILVNSKGESRIILSEDSDVSIKITETVTKSIKKPVVIDNISYLKSEVTGTIALSNTGDQFIQLMLTREISGEPLEISKGKVIPGECSSVCKKLQWRVSIDQLQKKEINYTYEALIPVQ